MAGVQVYEAVGPSDWGNNHVSGPKDIMFFMHRGLKAVKLCLLG
jgi:hypothetical protein